MLNQRVFLGPTLARCQGTVQCAVWVRSCRAMSLLLVKGLKINATRSMQMAPQYLGVAWGSRHYR